jgi:hypothetical protein
MNKHKQIELLTVLAEGCKKHPAYRAIRPASGDCEPCVRMWSARLELGRPTPKALTSDAKKHQGTSVSPINRHGGYDGTDAGFTSDSIQTSRLDKKHIRRARKVFRPINKHGNYDGTDAGFTSDSIQTSRLDKKHIRRARKVVRPINKHGNYDGTDVGFTSD